MHKRKTYHLNGVMTAVSSLTFAPPGSIVKSVHQLPTMAGRLYFPATGLRGKLRRLALSTVHRVLSNKAGDDVKFRLEDYFLSTLGGVKQGKGEEENTGDKGITDVSKLLFVREKNPLVSLFGAMAPITVPGLVQIGHALAPEGVKPDTINYVRSNELARNSEAWEMLNGDAADLFAELTGQTRDKSKMKAGRKAKIAGLSKADGEAKTALNTQIKEMDSAIKENKIVSIGQPGLNYQVIPVGTPFALRMVLRNVNELELSLFLHALAAFGFNPQIGSHASHGCGLVEMKFDVMEQGTLSLKKIGNIEINGDYTGAVMSPAVEALATPLDLSNCVFTARAIKEVA